MPFSSNRPVLVGIVLGFHATLGQVIISRESLAAGGGNELSVGFVLFAWMLFVGVGALWGKRLKNSHLAMILGAVISTVGIVAGLVLLRRHRMLLGVMPGAEPGLLSIGTVLLGGTFLGALGAGLAFTGAARSFFKFSQRAPTTVFAFEALGAAASGLLFAFFLSSRLDHFTVSILSGATLIVVTSVSSNLGVLPRLCAGLLGVLLLGATTAGMASQVDERTARGMFEDMGGSGEIVAGAATKYSQITVASFGEQYQVFSDGRLAMTFPDPYDRTFGVHAALLQHPAPRRLLLVGGGAPDRLAAALAHGPKMVVLTHTDEDAHTLMEPFFDEITRAALEDSRVRLVHGDGRRYVETTEERFDVVVVFGDAPASAKENRYHTKEFYSAVERILSQGGVVVAFAPGAANVLSKEAGVAAALEKATLESVFERVRPAFGWKTLLFGGRGQWRWTDEDEELVRRLEERGISRATFSLGRLGDTFHVERTRGFEEQLEAPSELNSDDHPAGFAANIGLWERGLDDPVAKGRGAMEILQMARWPLIILWLIFFAAVLWRGRAGGGGGFPWLSMGFTGLAGMGIEILILLTYQTGCGALYSGLAILVALFMAGLGAGAFAGDRLCDFRRPDFLAPVADGALVLLIASSPAVFRLLGSQPWALYSWSTLAGVFTGFAFPVYLALSAKGASKEKGRAAGLVAAADNLGAAFGALVVSVVWLPSFGVTICCVLLASLKLLASGTVFAAGRSSSIHKAH